MPPAVTAFRDLPAERDPAAGGQRMRLLLGPDHPRLGEVADVGIVADAVAVADVVATADVGIAADAGAAADQTLAGRLHGEAVAGRGLGEPLAGPVHGAALAGCGLGAALSAGWLPKAVAAMEPNEDGALLAVGAAGALLAVADGHNGSAAAVAALRALAVAAPSLLATPAQGADLAAAFAAAAHRAVTSPPASPPPVSRPAAGSVRPGPPPRSGWDDDRPARTALSLVVVTADAFAAVSYGDTVAAVVRHGRLVTLGSPSGFLGPACAADPSPGRPVAHRRRRPGDAVVVVSDGIPDYLGRAFPMVAAAAVRAHGPNDGRAAARSLVAQAGAAGAGDNITAAVLVDGRRRAGLSRLRRRSRA
jgi:hypothetical protein